MERHKVLSSGLCKTGDSFNRHKFSFAARGQAGCLRPLRLRPSSRQYSATQSRHSESERWRLSLSRSRRNCLRFRSCTALSANAASLDANVIEPDAHGHKHQDYRPPSCCKDHEEITSSSSRASQILQSVLRPTGLLALAESLSDKVWVTVAIALLFGAAALAAFAGGQQVVVQQIQQACITGIFLLAGVPEGVELLFKVLAGDIDTHVLMTLACFGTLAIGAAMEGALLLVLFQASHTVEHKLTERAQGNMESLVSRVPNTVTLVELDSNGAPQISAAQESPVSEVEVNSNALVMPGQQIPLDGVIVYGEALVSSEHITGEALPVRKGKGEEVPAGSINHDGLLVVQVSRTLDQSTPARIVSLTRQAQNSKPRIGRWLDSFGDVYSRCVIGGVIVSFAGLLLSGVPLLSTGVQRGAIYRALGLLSTASPCALVLVPLAYVSALAAVSNRGILLRESSVLDALCRCSTIAVDKTGTLTTGSLSCTGMYDPQETTALPDSPASELKQDSDWMQTVLEGEKEDDLLALSSIVALSERANHPVSKAVTVMAKGLNGKLPHTTIDNFHLVPGAGVEGNTRRNGKVRKLRFGSVEFATQGLPASSVSSASDITSKHGEGSIASLLVDSDGDDEANSPGGTLSRLLLFNDTVHSRSAAAIQELRRRDHRRREVIMLTGDNERVAWRVGSSLGIQHIEAGLTPQGKLDAIGMARKRSSSSQHLNGVIMVGDGINDAPALASADVGIAITSVPSEAAASVADVIFVNQDGISPLPFLLSIAHSTQSIIKQNLVIALGAMLALSLPTICGAIPLSLAVGLHEASTLLVALNSLRLLYHKDSLNVAVQ